MYHDQLVRSENNFKKNLKYTCWQTKSTDKTGCFNRPPSHWPLRHLEKSPT